MKLPSIFKNSSWKWRRIMSFHHSKSLFRHAKFMAMLDSSWSHSTLYLPTGGDIEEEGSGSVEMTAIEEALRSKRMSFDPGNSSSSILVVDDDDRDRDCGFCLRECDTMEVETEDPYGDFRVSMEEMVEAYEARACSGKKLDLDAVWEYLEEMLACYLMINHKKNHGFIVGAFIDVFIGFLSPSCSCDLYGSSSKVS